MSSQNLTLYSFVPFDRSGRVRWLLHELDLTFLEHRLNFRTQENREDAYLALNPTGKVPTLVDGETILFESGACLQYLAERYGKGKLVPGVEDPERPAYLTWMYFASSTLDPVCFELVRPDLSKEEKKPRMARARIELPRLLGAVQGQLGDRETMLPSGFSTVDVLIGSCLHYAEGDGQLSDFPKLRSYMVRLRERPAAEKAELFAR
jgi:glutathione S-transferase